MDCAMLYPKNQTPQLDDELFRSPTAEYRATPFWAWNTSPDREEMTRQIEAFRSMGFGGFHMHVRSGMDREYLGEEFFACIRHCIGEARARNMLAWLYDEDRWPSGAVGGTLTKDPVNRQHFLLFTCIPYCGRTYKRPLTASGCNFAERCENGELFACYDVCLDDAGQLCSYRRIEPDEEATGKKWYAYIESPSPNPWYNGQTYADLLSPEVTRQFVAMTHERYLSELGGRFDTSVTPAIFTDEPQMAQKRGLPHAFAEDDAVLPWSVGMEHDFERVNGCTLADHLPELFWDIPDGYSEFRYRFHNFITERFAASFADVVGAWCEAHGLPLTGHVMREPTLASQTGATGETMRSYRSFTLPGIDMLRNSYEYTTAKQAQSAVRQYGREGMISEEYGVTGWGFDFAGFKRQGDWQAALGVTVRVPHLSFLSMKGEAKRDYPASIGYQSPWCRDFRMVEDHFARLSTALSRGKALSRVAVIHPIESYWLLYGSERESAKAKATLDTAFQDLTGWLIFGGVDFDFISEALLPSLCEKGSAPLCVGNMRYDTVILPPLITLRASTAERLGAFTQAGGRLITLGELPSYMDAKRTDVCKKTLEKAELLPFDERTLLDALDSERALWLYEGDAYARDLLFSYCEDGEGRWLFLCNGRPERRAEAGKYRAVLKGLWRAEHYDTATGEHAPMAVAYDGNTTVLSATLHDCDTLLVFLTPAKVGEVSLAPEQETLWEPVCTLDGPFAYSADEANVLLLDRASYRVDEDAWSAPMELLRADEEARARYGLISRRVAMMQPWVFGKESFRHTMCLKFTILSEIEGVYASLAAEYSEGMTVTLNGEAVSLARIGHYVDRDILVFALPSLCKGENVLELTMPFGETSNTEWCYLLGDFGVRVEGDHAVIVPHTQALGVGDLAMQGMPFYAGHITYTASVEIPEDGEYALRFPSYGGTFAATEEGYAAYPPYRAPLGVCRKGDRQVQFSLCIPRANAFGPVHHTNGSSVQAAPKEWRTEGALWSEEYRLSPMGLLQAPVLEKKK